MTTLDTTAVNAAKQTFGDALSWGADPQDALSSALSAFADALSSLPAQAVDVRTPQRWRDVGYLMACIDDAIEQGYDPDVDGPLLDEIRAELKTPPSQPAAVGVTDEMVEAACAAKYGKGDLQEWLRGLGVPPRTFLRLALEAALRSTP